MWIRNVKRIEMTGFGGTKANVSHAAYTPPPPEGGGVRNISQSMCLKITCLQVFIVEVKFLDLFCPYTVLVILLYSKIHIFTDSHKV